MINNNTHWNKNISSTNYKTFTNNTEKHLKFSTYVYPLHDGFYHIPSRSSCNVAQDVYIRSGKKNGAGKIYTPDGSVYSVNFVNNIPQGPFSRVDSLGNTLTYKVVDGSPFGDAVEILNGRTINFSYDKNGLRNGKAVEFNNYGKIEFNYVNDVRQLAAKITGNDGKNYFLYYQSGSLSGSAKVFLPNGKIIHCNYRNGVPHGEASMILTNKNVITFNYVNGIPQGNAVETFNKGSATFTLNTGKIVGTVKFYSNRGSCLEEATTPENIYNYALQIGSSIVDNDMMETLYMEEPGIPQKAPANSRIPEKLKNEQPIQRDAAVLNPENSNKITNGQTTPSSKKDLTFYRDEDSFSLDSFDLEEQVLDSKDLSSPIETDGLETCFMEDEKSTESSASVDTDPKVDVDSWLDLDRQ